MIAGATQGSLPVGQARNTLVPAITSNHTRAVQQDPCSTQAIPIEFPFDVGGCTKPDGTRALAGDYVLSPCEVSSSSLVSSLLVPDLQLYDTNGNHAPNPVNTHPDSLSLAFGFMAMRAQFR